MSQYFEGFERKYFTTSDGVRLHYEEKGNGKPLIMIHGLASSYAAFCKMAPLLAEKYHVYVLDLRCHGLSDQPDFGLRISRLAKDVYEFGQNVTAGKANWAAHSMGCDILWSMIELFGQDNIENLVLIDQCPYPLKNPEETEEEAREHGGMAIDLWDFYNANQRSEDEGNAACFKYYQMERFPENPENYALLAQFEKKPSAFRQLGRLHTDHLQHDWRDLIPRIHVPTLYAAGGKSYATTYECQKWIADHIPGCRWFHVEDATHLSITLDYAEELAEEIIALIQ